MGPNINRNQTVLKKLLISQKRSVSWLLCFWLPHWPHPLCIWSRTNKFGPFGQPSIRKSQSYGTSTVSWQSTLKLSTSSKEIVTLFSFKSINEKLTCSCSLPIVSMSTRTKRDLELLTPRQWMRMEWSLCTLILSSKIPSSKVTFLRYHSTSKRKNHDFGVTV